MRVRSILARLLLPMNEIDIAVEAYEKLFAQKVRLRFDYPDKGLRLAQVGQLLLIGGDDASLKPFRETAMTFLVDDTLMGPAPASDDRPSQATSLIPASLT